MVLDCQARARRKHFSKNPDKVSEYGIGLKTSNSRALLEGWGQTIYDKTATDKLPKITETKRAALKTALNAYQRNPDRPSWCHRRGQRHPHRPQTADQHLCVRCQRSLTSCGKPQLK